MKKMKLTALLFSVVMALVTMSNMQCKTKDLTPFTDVQIVTKWARLTLDITKNTPANSPTFASRCLGYIGLTMYESIVHGSSDYVSMDGQLNGLEDIPIPDSSVGYNWQAALNAGQAEILRKIYIQTADSNKVKVDVLEQEIADNLLSQKVDKDIMQRSATYGRLVAEHIFEWSKSDGGHRGYLHNFDKELVQPNFPGSWKPPLYSQSFSHHPLHPYWGSNRTFVMDNHSLPNPKMIGFDTTETSAYYQQFLAVYEKDLMLTQEEKEAAIWWGDDPDETFTPPGHSFYIATLAIEAKQPSLIQCAETYARVGMAISDAFVKCWKWKYDFFSERPNTFIPEYIDEEWESFWPDPPFPSFPSGHAIQAATAATVMIDLYGNDFEFVDRAHVNRERDDYRDVDFVARSFNTFWEVAEETADSRFYGGIHTPQDNEVGLEEGKKIAQNVNDLRWRTEE